MMQKRLRITLKYSILLAFYRCVPAHDQRHGLAIYLEPHDMNKTAILGLALAALLPLTAAANEKYPASNFQPTVIYLDKDLVGEVEEPAQFDPKYPAAHFQPKVVYIDKEYIEQQEAAEQFDPKYPAAYFRPKVIYP